MAEKQEGFYNTFDTSNLQEASGGKPEFFNKMLKVFIQNTKETRSSLAENFKKKDWEALGNIAHKAIPSFKYFSLTRIVQQLEYLEQVTLRENDYEKVPDSIEDILSGLDQVIINAKDEIINTES